MARRAAKAKLAQIEGGRKGGRRSSTSTSSESSILSANFIRRDLPNYLSSWSRSPYLRYAAGGIGILVAGRLAMKYSGSFPAVTTFFRDNLEIVENKLNEFRGNSDVADVSDEARH